jgi:hypothetical protein
MVEKMPFENPVPFSALVLVSTALTQRDAQGLLLSCAWEFNPITIITVTKILLRCFILNFLSYNLVNYNQM